MVIPTYEFLLFPFMSFRNPFIHLISFAYIVKNVKFDTEKSLRKNRKKQENEEQIYDHF